MKFCVVRKERYELLLWFGITDDKHVKMTGTSAKTLNTRVWSYPDPPGKRRRKTRVMRKNMRLAWASPVKPRWAVRGGWNCGYTRTVSAQIIVLPQRSCPPTLARTTEDEFAIVFTTYIPGRPAHIPLTKVHLISGTRSNTTLHVLRPVARIALRQGNQILRVTNGEPSSAHPTH